jgi:hypothetical protein
MIAAFDLLVACLLLAVLAYVIAAYRAVRVRAGAAFQATVAPEESAAHSPPTRASRIRITGLWAEIMADGVRLRFTIPPDRCGLTSPIRRLVAAHQDDGQGAIYEMTTASGGAYLVYLTRDRARQVFSMLAARQNGQSRRPAGDLVPPARDANAAPPAEAEQA